MLRPDTAARDNRTVEIIARYRRAAVTMNARVNGTHHTLELPLRTSLGWRLVAPMTLHDDGSPMDMLCDALWLSGTLLLAGYWSAFGIATTGSRRARQMLWLMGSAGVLTTGFAIIPLISGVRPAAWWEVVAAVAFLMAGYTLGARMKRIKLRANGRGTRDER